MNEVFLCTIWHTGTKYFKKGLEDRYRVAYSHFNKRVIEQIKSYDKVFTTYRDPLRVAASWANRGHFTGKKNLSVVSGNWIEQWECYGECLKLNPMVLDFTKGREQYGIMFQEQPINSHSDSLGLHKAIDDEELTKLYQIIPKELIDLAQDIIKTNEKNLKGISICHTKKHSG